MFILGIFICLFVGDVWIIGLRTLEGIVSLFEQLWVYLGKGFGLFCLRGRALILEGFLFGAFALNLADSFLKHL